MPFRLHSNLPGVVRGIARHGAFLYALGQGYRGDGGHGGPDRELARPRTAPFRGISYIFLLFFHLI